MGSQAEENRRIDTWAYRFHRFDCARAMDGCGSTCISCRTAYFLYYDAAPEPELKVELGGVHE